MKGSTVGRRTLRAARRVCAASSHSGQRQRSPLTGAQRTERKGRMGFWSSPQTASFESRWTTAGEPPRRATGALFTGEVPAKKKETEIEWWTAKPLRRACLPCSHASFARGPRSRLRWQKRPRAVSSVRGSARSDAHRPQCRGTLLPCASAFDTPRGTAHARGFRRRGARVTAPVSDTLRTRSDTLRTRTFHLPTCSALRCDAACRILQLVPAVPRRAR